MATNYKFKVGYTKLGVATAPSVAPTINILNVATDALVVTGAAVTASAAMPGVYTYTYSGADGLDLIALFHTTDASMDQQDLFCIDIDKLVTTSISLGSGASTWPITVNDGVNPIDGVDVWISTDIAGTNVIARGYTNALGIITFYLDPGTYYAWKSLAGYTFTNPEAFTVT